MKGKRPSDNTLKAVKKANSKQFEIFDENFNFVKKVESQKELLLFLNVTYLNTQLKECICSNKLYKSYYIKYIK